MIQIRIDVLGTLAETRQLERPRIDPGQQVLAEGSATNRRRQIGVGEREALFSTVHGAGRVMPRTEAAGKRNWRTGKILEPGVVSPEMMHEWVRDKGVILRVH